MSEEEIKKRMLQEKMQQHMAMQSQSQQQQMAEAQQALKAIMSQILEPKARERLANLKVVKPELAMQLEMYLAQLAQAGQIQAKLTDEQVVLILRKLSEKREITIKRKDK
ncbi:MAG: hypothetical protein HY513_01280 [Candidatus Aenigmarchaeota archaeon]|nr:hypothetical protein [Candidatus Aenigmarchaeota archaeon]